MTASQPDPIIVERQRLGREIADARASREMNQTEIAVLAGVSAARVSYMETAAVDIRLSTFLRIADAVGLRVTLKRKAA